MASCHQTPSRGLIQWEGQELYWADFLRESQSFDQNAVFDKITRRSIFSWKSKGGIACISPSPVKDAAVTFRFN